MYIFCHNDISNNFDNNSKSKIKLVFYSPCCHAVESPVWTFDCVYSHIKFTLIRFKTGLSFETMRKQYVLLIKGNLLEKKYLSLNFWVWILISSMAICLVILIFLRTSIFLLPEYPNLATKDLERKQNCKRKRMFQRQRFFKSRLGLGDKFLCGRLFFPVSF